MKKSILIFFTIIIGLIFTLTAGFTNLEESTGAPTYEIASSDYTSDTEESTLIQDWEVQENPMETMLNT